MALEGPGANRWEAIERKVKEQPETLPPEYRPTPTAPPEHRLEPERGPEDYEWWEYDRYGRPPEEPAVVAPPTPTKPPEPVFEEPEFDPYLDDPYLSVWDRIKMGLNNWISDLDESGEIGDAAELAAQLAVEQFHHPTPKGIAQVAKQEGILTFKLGLAGLTKVAFPLMGQAAYLLERVVGKSFRNSSWVPAKDTSAQLPFLDRLKRDLAVTFGQSAELPKFEYDKEYEETYGRTPGEWLEKTYGDDPEKLRRAQVAAQELDRIGYTLTLNPEKFREGITRIVDKGEPVDDVLEDLENPLLEAVFQSALDPLDYAQIAAPHWITALRRQRLAKLIQTPVDEIADSTQAAKYINKIGGFGRTRHTRVHKAIEHIHDMLASALAHTHNLDEAEDILKTWGRAEKGLPLRQQQNIDGRLVEWVLKSDDTPLDEILLKARQKYADTQNLAEARSVIIDGIRQAAIKQLKVPMAGWVWKLESKLETWGRKGKSFYSSLFLGWNPQYLVNNWRDNFTNIVLDLGVGADEGLPFGERLALRFDKTQDFFLNRVGARPEHLTKGLGEAYITGTPTRIKHPPWKEIISQKKWGELASKVTDWFARPTLTLSGRIEQAASSLATYRAYKIHWSKNWGVEAYRLPQELADQFEMINPALRAMVENLPATCFGLDELDDAVAGLERAIKTKAAGERAAYGLGWYIQQLPQDQRALLRQREDLVQLLADGLKRAKTDADVDDVFAAARRVLDTDLETVLKHVHTRDLQTVGWAHQHVALLKAREPITRSFNDAPHIAEMLKPGRKVHDFDVLATLARQSDTPFDALMSPMTDQEFEAIRKGVTPAELWKILVDEHPVLAKYFPREGSVNAWDVADGAYEAVRVTARQPEGVINSRDAFWGLYKRLLPKGRQEARKLKEIRLALKTPGASPDYWNNVAKKLSDFVSEHPEWVCPDEHLDELQEAMEVATHYMWYKLNPKDWTKWATSDFHIDRLPDVAPNPYDAQKIVYPRLTAALDTIKERVRKTMKVEEAWEIPRPLLERYKQWVENSLKPEMRGTIYTTMRQAIAARDFAILDYGDRTYLDLIAGLAIPYEFWPIHNFGHWVVRMLEHPALMANFYRYRQAMEKINQDPLVPSRLKGWTPIGAWALIDEVLQGKPSAEDVPYYEPMPGFRTRIYTKPDRDFLPLESIPLFGETFLPGRWGDIGRGREILLIDNLLNSNPFVQASVYALNAMLPQIEQHHPQLAETIARYLPASHVFIDGAWWSGNRGVRGWSIILKPLLESMGLHIPAEGLNPEGMARDVLGLPRVSLGEEYWRHQWLANLAGTGAISEDEAWDAFISRSGPAWDMATEMAAKQVAVPGAWSWLGVSHLVGAGNIKFYPEAEATMRGVGELYKIARKKYEAGDRKALQEFYKQYPEYKLRQLAFGYWDVASGKLTPEDWQRIVQLQDEVQQAYRERANLEKEWLDAQNLYPLGTPEYERARDYFAEKRREWWEKNDALLDEWYTYIERNRTKYLEWRDGPKAQAMRTFLDKWYAASPEDKQRMVAELPRTMEEVAREVRGSLQPKLFTQQEFYQFLARNDEPVDAVYRELNNQTAKLWDLFYKDYFSAQWPELRDEYAAYLNLEFPDNIKYREQHPDLDAALTELKRYRDELLATELDVRDPKFKERILRLHPDWRGTDIEKELDQVLEETPIFTASEYTDLKHSDREMVISLLWRFYNSLGQNSLARKRVKEVFGPRFGELFLGQEYNQISDNELALWLQLLPSDWETLLPEGRRPPFGEGPIYQPDFVRAFKARVGDELGPWVPPEPPTREEYAYGPTARKGKEGEYISEEEAARAAAEAGEEAKEKVEEGVEKYTPPTPAEEAEYQEAYQMLQRALAGERELWNDPLLKKYFPPNSPSRRFWEFYYDSIPPGKLGEWARENPVVKAILERSVREYLNDEVYTDAINWMIDELPRHDIGDPAEYAQARRENEEFWALLTPELEPVYNAYRALPRRSKERREFLKAHPELITLFDAWEEFKKTHPVYVKYYDPDWIPRGEGKGGGGGRGGYWGRGRGGGRGGYSRMSWQEFVMDAGPLVMGQLVEFWMGRAALSDGALKVLKALHRKYGGSADFDDWLQYLRRLFTRFGFGKFRRPRAPKATIPSVGAPRVTGRARWQLRR